MGSIKPGVGNEASDPSSSRRSLYLIDIENLCGGPFHPRARRILGFFLLQSEWRNGDISYLAANHALLAQLAWEIQEMRCRIHARGGRDGADQALLADAPSDRVVERFDRVVIGSGDGIFAALAEHARSAGVEVEVVARPRHLSTRLALAADRAVPIASTWSEYRTWASSRGRAA